MSKYFFMRPTNPIWMRRWAYVIVALILALVFALYFIPEVIVGLANQAWALCGW